MNLQINRSIRPSLIVLFAGLGILSSSISQGAIEAVQFDDAVTEQRYQDLIAEIRCMVCQNQNLADSDADLAKDLRRKTAEMLKQGMSDQEILDYMSERYGDFVLYRPPLNAATALLWIGPFVLLAVAVFVIFTTVKRRQAETTSGSDETFEEARRMEIRKMLKNAPDLNSNTDTED